MKVNLKKPLIAAFFGVAGLFNLATAQDTLTPVRVSFQTQRINDTLDYFSVKVNLQKGVELFGTATGGTFVSTIQFDSAASSLLRKTDTVTAFGNSLLIQDPAGTGRVKVFTDSVEFRYMLHTGNGAHGPFTGSFAWLARKGEDFPSGQQNFSVSLPQPQQSVTAVTATADTGKPKSWLNYFWVGLLAGLAAVFFPCLYPLMPVTVTFFLKKHKNRSQGIRDALFYSLSIILIYGIPTTLLTLAFGDDALYRISVNPVTNLLFFAIFILFALSFFGLFEITLPSSWANKTDQAAGKGGFIGIFFMALTLVIVSFSCTGVVAGQLLGYLSREGLSAGPIAGMFGFGTGLALPFTILALFPSLLKSLPKSGGWLNTLKVTFAFIELAMALKFLSNVDLIYHWRLLDREVFLAFWIVIFILLGFYLLGKLKFSGDSEMPYLGIPRLFFAILSFSFVVYLIPGMWGAPLKSLSGWIPPASTQDFNLNDLQYQLGRNDPAGAGSAAGNALPPKLYTGILHAPLGLTAYFDLAEGMAAAKAENKPVMLDFTGHSCANCRKMEGQVWSDPEVLKRIKNDFVLISLYVDDPTDLPPSQQYTKADGEKVTTLGESNLNYEISKFGFNAQPLYMFLDLKGNPLSEVKYGYDPDIQKFIRHLDQVRETFQRGGQ